MIKLLTSPTANPKVSKNGKLGVLTAPLHLAPSRLSGRNVCPKATAGCIAACLHTAGNPIYMAGKTRARLARTAFYFDDRAGFYAQLKNEIAAHERRANRLGMVSGIRLNATSDVTWPKWIMQLFPETVFYDYTKKPNATKSIAENYDVTFSLAENNDMEALQAFGAGMNVAAVFFGPSLPKFMRFDAASSRFVKSDHGIRVIDGDEHDFRPSDPRHVFVGLRAKGRAKNDLSGFVR